MNIDDRDARLLLLHRIAFFLLYTAVMIVITKLHTLSVAYPWMYLNLHQPASYLVRKVDLGGCS
jgi:hypothetical protein